jgi:hypothetical protein
MVVALVALVLAMGGTGYAAFKAPKNSVTSSSIKNGQVKNADLGSNSVTSPKVKDGSLLKQDFAAGQLPAGPTGATGATGATGTQGPKGDKGDKGDIGPSTAFHFDSGTDILSWTGGAQQVASLSLPAGSYAVFAKVLANNNGAGSAGVQCHLDLGGTVLDDGFDGLTLDVGPGDRGYIPLSGTKTIASAGTATVTCTGGATGNFLNRHIEAIQLGSLS